MRINYKFQIQVTLNGLVFYLDKSVDIEVSTFEKFGDEPAIKYFIEDALNIYKAYFNVSSDKLAKDLDYVDLNFLLFLRTIEQSNFDDVKFDGDFVNLVGRHGEGFEFIFSVNEG